MTPEQKQQMMNQAEQWRVEVERRLARLGRGDIVETLNLFFSFFTPGGKTTKVWGGAADQDYLPGEGEALDLSSALFEIHRLKHEIRGENWPAVFEATAAINRLLPGAAEGVFFDKAQQRKDTGKQRKDLAGFKKAREFCTREAIKIWAKAPETPLEGGGDIVSMLAEMIDDQAEAFNGVLPEPSTIAKYLTDADKDPDHPLKIPEQARRRRGRPRR